MRVRVFRTALLVGSLLCAAVPAFAEPAPCTESPADCGRKEFEAGIDAYTKGDFQSASDHFKAAHGYRAHPVVLFNWALAEAKLGQHLEALDHFDRVLADPELPADLKPKVEEERARTERNVATIEVEASAGAQVTIDGAAVSGDPPRVRVNPGDHKVRSVQDGRVLIDRSVRVKSGERLRLTVDQTREVVVQKAKGPAAGGGDTGATPKHGPAPAWFFAGLGATAVLGGVTIWSALDTQNAFDDYERDLPNLNQDQVNQRVDAGHKKELRTNVLLGVTALAGVGTAAVGLFVVDWGGSGQKRAARTQLLLGPGGVWASGSF